ncbi:hypothetical protein TNCV_407261 [Trichonephila clavipes]|nr:hypothetical protein TNCV_407261 [Trichonephila clavipes]
MRAKAYCADLSLRHLSAGNHVQMYRSSGQSDAKPPAYGGQGRFPVRDNPEVEYTPRTIFIGQLPAEIKMEDLRKVFAKFGVITKVKILKGKSPVYPMFGFVTFKTEEQYDLAMLVAQNEGVRFKGRRLNVQVAMSTQASKIEGTVVKGQDLHIARAGNKPARANRNRAQDLSLGGKGTSSSSQLDLKKMIVRTILIVKCYSWKYSPRNWEFKTICQLATVAKLHYYVVPTLT